MLIFPIFLIFWKLKKVPILLKFGKGNLNLIYIHIIIKNIIDLFYIYIIKIL